MKKVEHTLLYLFLYPFGFLNLNGSPIAMWIFVLKGIIGRPHRPRKYKIGTWNRLDTLDIHRLLIHNNVPFLNAPFSQIMFVEIIISKQISKLIIIISYQYTLDICTDCISEQFWWTLFFVSNTAHRYPYYAIDHL